MSGASGQGAARRRRRISRWLAITASALAGLVHEGLLSAGA
ncbi:hypothetical protein NUV30_05175 [Kocuria rhizophila]|nr:hypothetical protein [Kocuria rhizophila]MCR4525776.1 hypothetical protein [Kocuria rhizophila]MDA4829622.1 hypothetical protein [Kocuria rhizophila]WSQ06104.1 hypothetical protein OG312_05380 [Kocuria rhizophila]